jgi:hypothetical protein
MKYLWREQTENQNPRKNQMISCSESIDRATTPSTYELQSNTIRQKRYVDSFWQRPGGTPGREGGRQTARQGCSAKEIPY